MTPIHTDKTTNVLGAPQGWDASAHGKCEGLPVHMAADGPYIYSWWSLTWRERMAVLFGKPVRVCIVSTAQPPISLEATAD